MDSLKSFLKILLGLAALGFGLGAVRNCSDAASGQWWRMKERKQWAQSGKKIDLNTASKKDLRRLPGVGAVFSERIVQNRPYRSAADVIHKVQGFGPKRWADIRDFVAPFPPDPKTGFISIRNRTSRQLTFVFLDSDTSAFLLKVKVPPHSQWNSEEFSEDSAYIRILDDDSEVGTGQFSRRNGDTIFASNSENGIVIKPGI